MKVEPSSLHLYKSAAGPRHNEFEYAILKRGTQDVQESPDSKERRSQIGSSFIRFGRSRFEGNLENADYAMAAGNEYDSMPGGASSSASRIARGRSDVIIRFGRSDLKNLRGTEDLKSIRYANKPFQVALQVNDLDQLAILCSNVLASSDSNANGNGNGNDFRNYLTKLTRLCNSLGLGAENIDDNRRKSKIIEILEDASQAETLKHE